MVKDTLSLPRFGNGQAYDGENAETDVDNRFPACENGRIRVYCIVIMQGFENNRHNITQNTMKTGVSA